jgi:hypothetical protein
MFRRTAAAAEPVEICVENCHPEVNVALMRQVQIM